MASSSSSLQQNTATIHNNDNRIIIHFDLDAFYVACERELNAELRGKPVGVSQYNPYGSLEERSPQDDRVVAHDNINDENGSLIAVSYEARAAGVQRNMRRKEALTKCPQLNVVVVPVKHGKASLTIYRNASKRVLNVLIQAIQHLSDGSTSSIPVQVASVDEIYVDVTALVDTLVNQMNEDEEDEDDNIKKWNDCIEQACSCTAIGGFQAVSGESEAVNTLDKDHVRKGSKFQVSSTSNDQGSLAWWKRQILEWTLVEQRLALGAWIAAHARTAVMDSFDGGVFTLSAGISTNKTLAKLASSLKKPNGQFLIDPSNTMALQKLYSPLPLSRIRGLGGKFGVKISETFHVSTIGQVSEISLASLQSQLDDKTALFLYQVSRGVCLDPVTPRMKPKSIECSKTFSGKLSITSHDTLAKWVGQLVDELTERLEEDHSDYNRTPSTLGTSLVVMGDDRKSVSTSCRAPKSLCHYQESAMELVLQLVQSAKTRLNVKDVTVKCISVSASQFVQQASGSASIMAAFERSGNTKTSSASARRVPVAALQRHKAKPPSVMDTWLSKNDDAEATKNTSGVKRSSEGREDGTGAHAMKKQAVVPANENEATSSRPVSLPTMEEIDPQVLRELPPELRASLMKDIERAHPSKKKTSIGIQNFFLPKSNKL